jgi:hypothetical protein
VTGRAGHVCAWALNGAKSHAQNPTATSNAWRARIKSSEFLDSA